MCIPFNRQTCVQRQRAHHGHRLEIFNRLCTPTPCSWSGVFGGPDWLLATRRPEAAAGKTEAHRYKRVCVLNDAEIGLFRDEVAATCQP